MVTITLVLIIISYLFATKSEELLCPSGCVCDMTESLRRASCTNEKLTTIEADIPDEVQFLDFSNNIISQLNDYAFKELNLHRLVILNISANSISQISLRAFDSMFKLQIIDLSDNVLHTLPPDVFENNLELLKLYLGGNKFGFLEPEPILSSKSLQVLDLSRCVISHLHPETFSKLPTLTTVDISQNFLIQLNVNIFENLSELKNLKFSNNNLKCDSEMENLISYLTKRQIKFLNICQKTQKFEKLVILEEPTEKSRLLNWNFDNCDIETFEQTSNHTKCAVDYKNSGLSILLSIILFSAGLLVGVSISCCYFNCIHISKKRRTTRRRRPIVRQRSQPIDEFLISETSYNLGVSTPILNRVRYSPVN